jgi:hypothetical protein
MARKVWYAALIWLVAGGLLGVAPVAAADAGDAAWAAARQGFRVASPLFRPTYLPGRFVAPQFSTNPYGVVYRGAGPERLIFAFAANPAGEALPIPPNSSTLLTVHGQPAYLQGPTWGPNNQLAPPFIFEIGWREAGATYRVRLTDPPQPGAAAGELVALVESLVPVGGDGAAAPRCFAETNRCVAGRFLGRWLAYGGLAINGYPLSGEFRQTLEDGREYTVQYFERVRLEWHPEQASPFEQVQLGQFGRRIYQERHGHAADPPAPQAGPSYDPATGHNIDGAFLDYWQRGGGLSQFGRPLTEPFPEALEDGRVYHVQYFERARFEWHPEQGDPQYQVLLGQFGRQILAADAPGAVGAGR